MKTTLAILASLAAAMPAVTAQATFRVLIAADANFQGTQFNLVVADGQCRTFNPVGGLDFRNVISSVRPDQGVACTLFNDDGCTGVASQLIVAPTPNLSTIAFNDSANSMRCTKIVPVGDV